MELRVSSRRVGSERPPRGPRLSQRGGAGRGRPVTPSAQGSKCGSEWGSSLAESRCFV